MIFFSSGGSWTPHKVELAVWTHYVARDNKPEILADMPSRQAHYILYIIITFIVYAPNLLHILSCIIIIHICPNILYIVSCIFIIYAPICCIFYHILLSYMPQQIVDSIMYYYHICPPGTPPRWTGSPARSRPRPPTAR